MQSNNDNKLGTTNCSRYNNHTSYYSFTSYYPSVPLKHSMHHCFIAFLGFIYSHTQRTILVICISLFEMIRMFSSLNNLSLVLYIVREVYGISGRNCLLTHLWWCNNVMQSLNAFVYWKILIRKWIPLENQNVFYEYLLLQQYHGICKNVSLFILIITSGKNFLNFPNVCIIVCQMSAGFLSRQKDSIVFLPNQFQMYRIYNRKWNEIALFQRHFCIYLWIILR